MKSVQYGALVAIILCGSASARDDRDPAFASPNEGIALQKLHAPVARTTVAQVPKWYDWCESKFGTFQCPEGQYCYGSGKDQHCARPGSQRSGERRTGTQKARK